MQDSFLKWTSKNETTTEQPFVWKKLKNGSLNVLGTGLLEFVPEIRTDRQIVYSCGVHGNETGPIEIINDIITDINNEIQTCIHHTLFIIGNPKSMNLGKRFCDENLNRLFARELDSKKENYEVLRAKEIIQVMKDFFTEDTIKTHYDLHTAIRPSELKKFAIYPYTPHRKVDKGQLGFLETSGIDAVVFSNSEATTFSFHSSSIHGARSFTLELGKVESFGNNDRKNFQKIENNLRKILDNSYQETQDISHLKLFQICTEVIKNDETFSFSFDSSLPNFSKFQNEQLISKDKTQTILASGNEQRIIFPNPNVKVGERAALIIGPKSLPM